MSASGSFIITTQEPLDLQMSPKEDWVLVWEDVEDDAAETPIPHFGTLYFNLIDRDGAVVLPCSTDPAAGGNITQRAGTVNVYEIIIPAARVLTVPPGQYTADLIEVVGTAASTQVIASFVIQRLSA